MKIKVSSIIWLGIIVIFIENSYILTAFGLSIPFGNYITKILPLFLALVCILNSKMYRCIRPYAHEVNIFVFLWSIFFLVEVLYTLNLYSGNVSIDRIFKNYSSLTYIFLVYPILYILVTSRNKRLFFSTIISIAVIDGLLRATNSIIFSSTGISVFRNLTTKLGGSRILFYRMPSSKFHVLAFDLTISGFFISMNQKFRKRKYIWISVFFLFYTIFIGQSRSDILSMIIILLIWTYNYLPRIFRNPSQIKLFYLNSIISAVVIFLLLGGFNFISNSFSTNGSEAGSTLNRIYSLQYYAEQIKDKQLLGMGLIYDDSVYASNSSLYEILRNPDPQNGYAAYLEDFGLIGSYFNYGLLGIVLFTGLLFRFYLITKKRRNDKESSTYKMLRIVFFHLVLNCILPLSIFKNDMLMTLPLYLAIFEYYNLKSNDYLSISFGNGEIS